MCDKTSRATKTERDYVQCSCQSTRVGVWCDGAAKPELINSCTVRSRAFCGMRHLSHM